MGLLSNKGNVKNKNTEDLIKVLSTNIEVINQRLAMTQGYGMAEYHALVRDGIESINAQLSTLLKLIRSNEIDVKKLIDEDSGEIIAQINDLKENMPKNVGTEDFSKKMFEEMQSMKKEVLFQVVSMAQILDLLVKFNMDWIELLKTKK